MRFISPTLHGIIDYLAVLFLILAPGLFNLGATATLASYILAAIIAGLTVFTNFAPGLFRLVSVPTHGGIDLVTAFVIAALPWILGFADQTTARNLFLAVAVAVFGVWLLTNWRAATHRGVPATS